MLKHQVRGIREHRNSLYAIERRLCTAGPRTAEGKSELERVQRDIHAAEAFLRSVEGAGAATPDEHRTTQHYAFCEFLRGVARRSGQVPAEAVRNAWADLQPELRAALNTGTGSQGGFTVPAWFDSLIVEANSNYGCVESLAGYFETVSGSELDIPAVSDPAQESAALISEAGAYSESEETFLQYKAGAYKFGNIVKASDEWASDSGVDPVSFLASRGGRAISIALNTKLVLGTGTGQPQGITNNTVGVTLPSGQTTSITSADSLEDLFFSVLPPYRDTAVWLMADTTLKAVRKLKASGSGEWVFKWSDTPGVPDTLLGRPVYPDPDMPTMAANATSVLFGDLGANLLVRRIVPATLKVLTEPYGANDQIGFRIDRRVDAKIVDPAAARLLQQSAT
jgi:HK97 family phage major capsid protein